MDQVQDVKDRVDILEVISSYLTLKRSGVNWKACCPFHNEKTPSMMVNPERQSFKCFGCGEGGDVFTFIEKMEGVDFYNALKILADRAGIQLKNDAISYAGKEFKPDKKTRLYEVNDWAKKLYHRLLLEHPKAERAREYLKQRGLSLETIKKFEIGYAPKSWDLLIKFLEKKHYTTAEVFTAGLLVKNNQNNYYDRFRGRIMFPINNAMGITVAFTSRIIEDDPNQPKYINSAESPIYIKGKTIYGLDKAKMAIREEDQIVLVEGNMDVIACHQANFTNTVATSGTALTEEQIKILSRYASTIIFSFDSDPAGKTAFKRATEMAVRNDVSTKVVSIPFPYKDPDEVIKANPKLWREAIAGAKPSVEHWIDMLVKESPDLKVLEKKQIAKEILPLLKKVYSDIEKECYIKYLSGKIMVSEKSLISALEKTKGPKEEGKTDQTTKPSAKLSMEEKALGILWLLPELGLEVDLKLLISSQEQFKDFLSAAGDHFERKNIPNQQVVSLDQFALMVYEEYQTQDRDVLLSELKFLLARIANEKRESLRMNFAEKIRQAEEGGDKTEVKKLLSEFANLIK